MNKVSVVVVSWNSKHFLVDCLRSLAAQEEIVRAQEIVVVDNASVDGTAEAVFDFNSAINVIRNTANIGFAAGNNLGIVSTNSQYIALINPDVVLMPDCLGRLCAYMDEHPGVGLIGPKVTNPDGTLQESYWEMPTLQGRVMRALGMNPKLRGGVPGGSASEHIERAVDVLSGCFWLVRRSALSDVGLLDEGFFMYAEDTDWCKRFWDSGWKVVYLPSASAMHYGGGSSALAPTRSYVEMHRANLRYWRKHYGWLGQTGAYAIMLFHQVLRVIAGGILFLSSSRRREALRPVVRRSLACLCYLCTRVRPPAL